MMLPSLISVSLAPVSYFFCASAPLLVAARSARAAATAAARNCLTGIWISLSGLSAFPWKLCRLLRVLNTFRTNPSTKTPCDQLAGGIIWARCNKAREYRFHETNRFTLDLILRSAHLARVSKD